MNKYFIKTSLVILGVTLLNSSIGSCMEDDNHNSVNEENINLNVINEHPKQNNKQIQNNNYNSAQLISTTAKFLNKNICNNIDDDKNYLKQDIRNYLNNIREFYNSYDTNILQQLTSMVHNTIKTNNQFKVQTNFLSNRQELHNRNIANIYSDRYEDLLIFNLFLNIMTNIEHTGERVWLNKSKQKWSIFDTQINLDGECWWISKNYIQGEPYSQLLAIDTEAIINELTELYIQKYFVLDDPNTWMAKDRLIVKIKDKIRDICDVFDELPISKKLLNSKNTTTYENIPAFMDYVSEAVNRYFNKTKVETTLVRELTRAFKEQQWTKMYANSRKISSKYMLPNIGQYYNKNGNKFLTELAAHYSFPQGLFDDPKGIPSIVLSYLKDKLENGQTWIVPKPIYSYMKKYNLIHEQ